MKKTLFVSRYAPPIIGGPQNMHTLIRSLPKDRYVILTSFYNIDNTSAQIGLWLPGRYAFYDNPGASRETAAQNVSEPEHARRRFVHELKILAKRSAFMRAILGVPVISTQLFAIVKHGLRVIREQNIEMVVGFSDYGPATIGAYLLHRISDRPFAIFCFDIYKGNLFPFPGNILASIFEPRIMRAASKIIVTNAETAGHYGKLYGPEIAGKTVLIHNASAVIHTPNTLPSYQPTSPYSIVFTGSVFWPQIAALRNMSKAIKGSTMRLKLYTAAPFDQLRAEGLINDNVDYMGAAPPEMMPQIQGSADILFLPLSWNTRSPLVIETATPGKLTDYLAAGRPMLVHAPPKTCVVRYVRKHDCALVVDEDSPRALRSALDRFFEDPVPSGQRYVKNARLLYKLNHDPEKKARLFRSILE